MAASEAFADMLFSQSKSVYSKRPFSNRISDYPRPCSQNNTRISKKVDKFNVKPVQDFDNSTQKILIQLTEENKQLRSELENMRKINKKLLNSDTFSDEVYKGFYQTVLVDHLQKKVENLGVEANYYRQESQKNSLELDYLKKDKKYIQALAKKYKNLSTEKSANKSPVIKQSLSEALKDKSSLVFEKKIHLLSEFIEKVQEKSQFLEMLSAVAEFLQKSLKAEKVSMVLVSEEMQELYGKHVRNSFKHSWNDTKIIIAEGMHLSPIETSEMSLPLIKAGFISGKELFSTVFVNGEAGIYIRLKKKIVGRGEFSLFTAADFNYFNLITGFTSMLLKFVKCKERETQEIKQLLDLTGVMASLINNKNHKELANNVFKAIPRFLEYESAGIIFRDKAKEEFFTLLPSEAGGDKFSDTVALFSIDCGVTGDVYHKNIIGKYENIKSHRLFNSEIDNSCRCAVLHNCIFASLTGIDGEVLGVLQVFNKQNGKTITEKDLEKVKYLQKIIGMCINCTLCITEVSSLTINFKDSVHDAISSIEAIDKSQSSSELFEIKNYLNGLKNNMAEWASQKRQKMSALG